MSACHSVGNEWIVWRYFTRLMSVLKSVRLNVLVLVKCYRQPSIRAVRTSRIRQSLTYWSCARKPVLLCWVVEEYRLSFFFYYFYSGRRDSAVCVHAARREPIACFHCHVMITVFNIVTSLHVTLPCVQSIICKQLVLFVALSIDAFRNRRWTCNIVDKTVAMGICN